MCAILLFGRLEASIFLQLVCFILSNMKESERGRLNYKNNFYKRIYKVSPNKTISEHQLKNKNNETERKNLKNFESFS